MAYTGARPSYVSFPVDYFSGDGVTTAFNLTYSASAEGSVLVTVNNQHVYANKYNVNSKSLVFINYTPPVGVNNIEVIYLGIPAISENVLGVTSVGIISNLAGITVGNSPVITSGVMSLNGTLAVGSGGTGATSYGNNLLLVGNGSNPIGTLANTGASNQALISNGTGSNPSWQNIVNSFSAGTTGLTPSSASTGAITLSGTLNVASGGTGVNTLPINRVLLGNASSPMTAVVGTGTVGQVLTSQGNNPPSWQDAQTGSGTVTSVGLVAPAGFTVSNTPITTTGNLEISYSGLIPATSLGAGTTDATTFLRGDSSWQSIISSIGLTTTLSGITISGSPLTSSGTITIDGILNVANGGTGTSNLASGELLLGNGASAITALPNGTLNQILTSNGTGAPPSWQTLVYVSTFSGGSTGLTPSSATSSVVVLSGTLNVAHGGTGTTSLASGELLLGNGSSAISSLTNGTNGQVLTVTGGALGWSTPLSSVGITTTLSGITVTNSPITSSGNITLDGTLGVANGGTGATSLASGELLLGNGSSAISSLTNGTNGQVLTVTGGALGWSTPLSSVGITTTLSGITITNSPITSSGNIAISGVLNVANGGTGATNLNANEILLGNGSSAITSLANGSNGQFLMSVSGTPTWQAPPYTQTTSTENTYPPAGGFALCNLASGTTTPPNVGTSVTQTSTGPFSYGGAGGTNYLPAGTYIVTGRNGSVSTTTLMVLRVS